MIKTLSLAALVMAQVSFAGAPAAAACKGADPAIVSVTVQRPTTNGGNNQYHLNGVVVNAGTEKQAANVLQFVDVIRDREKMDSIGVPPLKPGQSYAFGWTFERSQEAGDGTTTLHFQIRMRQPAGVGKANCNPTNDSYTVTF